MIHRYTDRKLFRYLSIARKNKMDAAARVYASIAVARWGTSELPVIEAIILEKEKALASEIMAPGLRVAALIAGTGQRGGVGARMGRAWPDVWIHALVNDKPIPPLRQRRFKRLKWLLAYLIPKSTKRG